MAESLSRAQIYTLGEAVRTVLKDEGLTGRYAALMGKPDAAVKIGIIVAEALDKAAAG